MVPKPTAKKVEMTDIKGANQFGIDSVLINPQNQILKSQELDADLMPNFTMNL